MQYEADRDKVKEPFLSELTEKAIKILQKDEDGFFLMVEGKLDQFSTQVYYV